MGRVSQGPPMLSCRHRSLALTATVAALAGAVAGGELSLPRKELDDVVKAIPTAGVEELTKKIKSFKKAITAGGKGFGDNRREATLNARKRLTELENELANVKKITPSPPELDIEKLEIGQIGALYRIVRFD